MSSIVLVHGLFGHPKGSWATKVATKASEKLCAHQSNGVGINAEFEEPPRKKLCKCPRELLREVFWPRDILPKVFPMARILTWGYDVQIDKIMSAASKASIFNHAETLLVDLAMIRRTEGEKTKPIIFIAHSLGGIVVKDALSLSRNENTFFNEIFPATKGVMFLGTPHHGSNVATLGKIAFELSRVFLKDPNVQILRGLETNSETLERISRNFGQILSTGRIQVHSFREELETNGVEIVDAHSSTIGYFYETRGSLHANHRNMAKFTSVDDVKFQRVASVLSRWIDEFYNTQPLEKFPILAAMSTSNLPDGLIFDELYQKCLQSLNISEARKRFEDVENAYKETHSWLFEDEVGFTNWLNGKNPKPIFWIQGKPGSGKSTVMKYGISNSMTRQLLKEYDDHSWVIASYFFHDRGSIIQKSVEGFLREVLYQVLYQRKEIFVSNFTIFNRLIIPQSSAEASLDRRQRTLSDVWTLSTMQEALLSIVAKTESDVNVCLFVDALDEHDGNHKNLLSILRRLTESTRNPFFRLRLCLASRPENIFKHEFQDYPGFSIHERTVEDIRLYVEGITQPIIGGKLTEEGIRELQNLTQTIIKKSQGVFLWVRLVMDELIEGLCEGDSIEELGDLLSVIPTELGELYSRALRRPRRSSLRTSVKTKEEAYVMFQIAMCSREPFCLYDFLSAALFLSTGRKSYELERLYANQLESRLYSRSAGLLEAPTPYSELSVARSKIRTVQFIHQTVKEFMIVGEGSNVIREGIEASSQESGYVLIFRYILHLLNNYTSDYVGAGALKFVRRNFLYYARISELQEKRCVAKDFESSICLLSERAQNEILTLILDFHQAKKRWSAVVHGLRDRPRVRLLFFYVLCGLRLSLCEKLPSHKADLVEEDSLLLLEGCVYAGFKQSEPSEIFEALLEAGIGANLSSSQLDALENRLKK